MHLLQRNCSCKQNFNWNWLHTKYVISSSYEFIYNLDDIDPVGITVELPENQKISSDKHRGISWFFCSFHIFRTVGFYIGLVQTNIVPPWKLNIFGKVPIGEFVTFLNIYTNTHLTHLILYWYGCERDVHFCMFNLS